MRRSSAFKSYPIAHTASEHRTRELHDVLRLHLRYINRERVEVRYLYDALLVVQEQHGEWEENEPGVDAPPLLRSEAEHHAATASEHQA